MSERTPVNQRIADRRAEVRRGRRRRRLRRTIIISTLISVLVGGVLVERSSLVALTSVDVVGLDRLDRDAVLAAGDVTLGTSVLRLRPATVRDAVEALPLVERATVERTDGLGLRIEVVEVAPALTATFGGEAWLVAADGLVLGPGSASGTPTVTVSGPAPLEGDRVASRPPLAAAHAVLLGLPGPIDALVDDATAVSENSIELVLTSGTIVLWGDDTRGDEKARALGAVLEDLGGLVVAVIDVRAPGAPTVTAQDA